MKTTNDNPLPKGMAEPARNVLFSAGITTLGQVAEQTESELQNILASDPQAVVVLRDELAEQGLSFAGE
jgi:predicted flap endonuclease-1-like 5' DNA nuclease